MNLKVTGVETFAVAPRWVFVRVSTDSDIVGWGEASLEGHSSTVAEAVGALAERLRGEDPLRINDFWQVGWRGGFYRGGPVLSSALAGIDQALWDIAGKARGVPVYDLLGGPVRERVRAYSWIGGDRPEDVAKSAHEMIAMGRTAVKMNACAEMAPIATMRETSAVVERAAAVREAIGPDSDFAIDFHGRVSAPMASRLLRLLAPYEPLFVEEPLLPELGGQLRELIARSPIPIATGERLYSRWDFREPLESGVAVVQPDLSHAGGISEVRAIASVAEMYGALLAPHCPLGPIALAACLQVCFAVPNVLIQEHGAGIHYNEDSDLFDYLTDRSPLEVVAGYVSRPTAPGLGIQIDEEMVRSRAGRSKWRTPLWRLADGVVAEW